MKMTWRLYARLLREYVGHRRGALLVAGTLGLIVIGIESVGPALAGTYAQYLVESRSAHDLRLAWGLLVISYVFLFLSNVLQFSTVNAVKAKVVGALRVGAFARLQRARARETSSGDVIVRLLDDVVEAHELLTSIPISILLNCVWFLVTFLLLARASNLFAIVVLITIPVYLLLNQGVSLWLQRFNRRILAQRAKMTSDLEENLRMVATNRAYGLHQYWIRRFEEKVEDFVQLRTALGIWQGLASSASHAIGYLLPAVLLLLGGREVLSGQMTIGTMLTCYGYASRVFIPVDTVCQLLMQGAISIPALQRVVEVLEWPQERTGGSDLRIDRGVVEFRSVSFAYSGKEPAVVNSFSAVFQPDVLNFLVGPNGAGKSTLLRLLLRLDEPDGGCILVDGQDLCECRVDSVRSQISVVLQQGSLLQGTLLDNIRLGNLQLSEESVKAHLQKAGLIGLLGDLAEDWSASVGPQNTGLSGGQAQRILLARALVRNAPILLVDEGTAHMDADAESAVYSALAELVGRKTVIVVTHRVPRVSCPYAVVRLNGSALGQLDTREASHI